MDNSNSTTSITTVATAAALFFMLFIEAHLVMCFFFLAAFFIPELTEHYLWKNLFFIAHLLVISRFILLYLDSFYYSVKDSIGQAIHAFCGSPAPLKSVSAVGSFPNGANSPLQNLVAELTVGQVLDDVESIEFFNDFGVTRHYFQAPSQFRHFLQLACEEAATVELNLLDKKVYQVGEILERYNLTQQVLKKFSTHIQYSAAQEFSKDTFRLLNSIRTGHFLIVSEEVS